MAYTLRFRKLYQYDPTAGGITIPVVLSAGDESLSLVAKLDTGADRCVFRREHGEALGLNIEAGMPLTMNTAMGSFKTYGHEASLTALGVQFDGVIYFAANPGFTRSVLGRSGFLDRLRIALIEYDRLLYLSRYDDRIG